MSCDKLCAEGLAETLEIPQSCTPMGVPKGYGTDGHS